jgi:hypothetical protein
MVLNVQVKMVYKHHQVSVKKPDNNESLLKCRKGSLDCHKICVVTNKRLEIKPYDTIRSAFIEGEAIYPDSNFTERLDIEICVLNIDLIKGYFLPRPIEEHNPYLKKEFNPKP